MKSIREVALAVVLIGPKSPMPKHLYRALNLMDKKHVVSDQYAETPIIAPLRKGEGSQGQGAREPTGTEALKDSSGAASGPFQLLLIIIWFPFCVHGPYCCQACFAFAVNCHEKELCRMWCLRMF